MSGDEEEGSEKEEMRSSFVEEAVQEFWGRGLEYMDEGFMEEMSLAEKEWTQAMLVGLVMLEVAAVTRDWEEVERRKERIPEVWQRQDEEVSQEVVWAMREMMEDSVGVVEEDIRIGKEEEHKE